MDVALVSQMQPLFESGPDVGALVAGVLVLVTVALQLRMASTLAGFGG